MIPWDKIPKEYEYCAIDGGGPNKEHPWLFDIEPVEDDRGTWGSGKGTLVNLTSLFNFVTADEVEEYLKTSPDKSLIHRYDYEESTVVDSEHSERSDRDDIKEDIRRRLVKIKGIGPEKAEKGSDAVMEYLDILVERQQDVGRKEYTVDRPEGVPNEYSYVAFKSSGTTEITNFWVTADRPERPPSIDDPKEPGKFQGLFAYTSDVGDEKRLESQLLELLREDPKTFYARFKDG